MDNAYLYTFASVIGISLISFVGIFTLSMSIRRVRNLSYYLVSFAVGALLGDAFIHLLPESFEQAANPLLISFSVLAGFGAFFVLEKYVRWQHCHAPVSEKHNHPVAIINIVGDGVHNLIDGIIIASSFLVSPEIGITTTVAVIAHEIPQEISDFGILIHAGWKVKKALFMNFLSAFIAVLGAGIGLLIGTNSEGYLPAALAITAGGFIYIGASDLVPDLHEKVDARNSLTQIVFILLGVITMSSLLIFE